MLKLKAFFLFSFLLFLSSPSISQKNNIALAFPIDNINIDGKLNDWPNDITKHPIENIAFGKITDENDFSSTFQVAYNESNSSLYLAIEIIDAEHVNNTDEKGIDISDYILMYLDPIHSSAGGNSILFQASETSRDYASYYKAWNSYLPDITWDDIELKVSRDKFLTTYEFKIFLGNYCKANRVIGFDLVASDFDKETDVWLTWKEGTSKSSTSTRLGEIVFAESPQKVAMIKGQIDVQDTLIKNVNSVIFTSTSNPNLWARAKVDLKGHYKVALPISTYKLTPFQNYTSPLDGGDYDQDSRKIISDGLVIINNEYNKTIEANPLQLKTKALPLGMFETKGILHQENFNEYKLDQFIQNFQDYFDIPGVSVALIKDKEVIYDKVFGMQNNLKGEALELNTLFEGASITKTVFAVMVLGLAEKGIIDLDKPLYEYLSFPNITHDERHKLITARHILNHRTGLDNWPVGSYTGFLSDVKAELLFEPGTGFKYSGEAMNYLGRVIAHLTKKSLSQLFEEELVTSFGMNNTYFSYSDDLLDKVSIGHLHKYAHYKDKFPNIDSPASSIHTNAHDFSNFLTGLLHKKYLSKSSYDLILHPKNLLLDQDKMYDAHLDQGIAHGFFVVETPEGKLIGHGGNNGDFECKYGIMPEKGLGYVVFTNSNLGDEFIRFLELYLLYGMK